tara:strand:+ start:138 stop:803 length:666 start_codon:yes stop_codon:yes gene_type:complete
MKKIVLTSILISFFGCSETNTFNKLNEIEVSFSSNHKMMSNKEQIREAFIELLLDESSKKEYLQNQLYQNSWVYAFQSKRKWPNKYELKIKEHQPIAKWQEGKFITQSGVLINPENKIKEIELITLIGSEDEKYELLDISRKVQAQLNRFGEIIETVTLSSAGYLLITTRKGMKMTFSKKNFREQLERLEGFISFELFSGKLNLIKTMDFRYRNGVSILFN